MGRVNACHSGEVLPSRMALAMSTSMTEPFSACIQMVPPFSLVRISARKMVASSDMKMPG